MTNDFQLGDYVQVKDRLAAALKDYPKLVVRELNPTIVQIGDRTFIETTVELYAEPGSDHLLSRATAWEPFPGRTPYTRDSEQQNSSTSSLGRALGFLGYGIGKSIATAEDVVFRSAGDEAPPQGIPRPDTESHPANGPKLRMVNPVTPKGTIPNKFAKPCAKCGEMVKAETGLARKTDEGWITEHRDGQCDTGEEPF